MRQRQKAGVLAGVRATVLSVSLSACVTGTGPARAAAATTVRLPGGGIYGGSTPAGTAGSHTRPGRSNRQKRNPARRLTTPETTRSLTP